MDIAVWNGGIRVQREMRVLYFVLSISHCTRELPDILSRKLLSLLFPFSPHHTSQVRCDRVAVRLVPPPVEDLTLYAAIARGEASHARPGSFRSANVTRVSYSQSEHAIISDNFAVCHLPGLTKQSLQSSGHAEFLLDLQLELPNGPHALKTERCASERVDTYLNAHTEMAAQLEAFYAR